MRAGADIPNGPPPNSFVDCWLASHARVAPHGHRVRPARLTVSFAVVSFIHPASRACRMMNRAARISARATSGCVMCSEGAWKQAQAQLGRAAPGLPEPLFDEPRRLPSPSDISGRKVGCVQLKGVGQLTLYTCTCKRPNNSHRVCLICMPYSCRIHPSQDGLQYRIADTVIQNGWAHTANHAARCFDVTWPSEACTSR